MRKHLSRVGYLLQTSEVFLWLLVGVGWERCRVTVAGWRAWCAVLLYSISLEKHLLRPSLADSILTYTSSVLSPIPHVLHWLIRVICAFNWVVS